MNPEWHLAELERRLQNLLRVGVIAEVDSELARVRVRVGELLTAWIPWLAGRAGSTCSWSAPVAGEQVLLLSPAGDFCRAVALPALYQDRFPAPDSQPWVDVLQFADGSVVRFDARKHVLDVVAGSGQVNIRCARVTLEASAEVRLETPKATCSGDLMVMGRLGYAGGLEGEGGAVIRGGAAIAGEMRNNGINIGSGHRHRGVRGGSDSSGEPF